MKKHIILSAGFAIATIAVLVATQSVNHAAPAREVNSIEVKMPKTHRLYTSDDVEYLMKANHWSREQAVQVLGLASRAAETRMNRSTGI